MTRPPGEVATLSEVADVVAAQRLSLAEAALEAMRAEIPRYAALADEALLADVVAHVTEAIDALSVSLAHGRPVTDEDVAFVRPHAARRARQGMPLVDFMHALRIAHRLM
ncbi:hypothetical protein [Streptomyces regalis]|uniref:hypothetical protein n=1 Tax=Streptomyces regalis TaxID=68262 RepID=UPI000B2EF7C1|nr:hypothetical protein [Streptomyces regalis]